LRAIAVSNLGGPEQPLDGLSLLKQPSKMAQKIRLHLKASLDRLSAPQIATA
jgi:hypothetical protein